MQQQWIVVLADLGIVVLACIFLNMGFVRGRMIRHWVPTTMIDSTVQSGRLFIHIGSAIVGVLVAVLSLARVECIR